MMAWQASSTSPNAAWSATIREDSPTEELVAWSLERFAGQRMAITTSFGMEGCVLIDLYARHADDHGRDARATHAALTVVYLDTMFFFPETYALRDRMVERYPHLVFINRGTDLTPEQQAEQYRPQLWESDPDLCCKLRKVKPMAEALAGVDVCITGLTRHQSCTRANLRVIDWDWKTQTLKISPLAAWDRPRVWDYVKAHDVPYNELHEKGYPTIGCTHCTKQVPGSKIGEYSRDGRWSGKEKTECGLHGDGI